MPFRRGRIGSRWRGRCWMRWGDRAVCRGDRGCALGGSGDVDVLRLLARRVEQAGVVVVVTYRDDELAANSQLAMLVGDLVSVPAVRRLPLRRLSESAVGSLAASSGVDGRELSRLTSGNPFLVVEALAAGDGLPSTVRDATLARVGSLDADARGVVDAAAVIGQRVSPGLLVAVASSSAGAVEDALACGVLIEDGGELVFRHELTRQAVRRRSPRHVARRCMPGLAALGGRTRAQGPCAPGAPRGAGGVGGRGKPVRRAGGGRRRTRGCATRGGIAARAGTALRDRPRSRRAIRAAGATLARAELRREDGGRAARGGRGGRDRRAAARPARARACPERARRGVVVARPDGRGACGSTIGDRAAQAHRRGR